MIRKMFFAVLAMGIFATSCGSDDDNGPTTSSLTIDFTGLDELGNGYVYEGWIIIDGAPVSTGVLTSLTFPQTITMETAQIEAAATFVLSIEPPNDTNPDPAPTKILAGDFSGNTANVSSRGIVGDFSSSTGAYILATPTDGGGDTNEESGVWFLDNSSGTAVAGLNLLPILNDGWIYEGWAVIGGVPVSTGTFTSASGFDDNATTTPFKGDAGDGPAFPGEDFLQNAPSGMTFPTDLKGATIVISVEPSPDNSAGPFTLKPLVHVVPTDAMNHVTIAMGTGLVAELTGIVTR